MEQINAQSLENIAYNLSTDQEKIIINLWNDAAKEKRDPPSLRDLGKACWGEFLDLRNRKIQLIKRFLASRQLKAQPTTLPLPTKEVIVESLTVEEKEFIKNNFPKLNAFEIGKILLNTLSINQNDPKFRAISLEIKRLESENRSEIDFSDTTYYIPKNIVGMVRRVNKYLEKNLIDEKDLDKKTKENLEALISHINCLRFKSQLGTYETESDRDLFESSFLGYTITKAADLTPEERDQFIILATEVVISKNILRRINRFEKMEDDVADDNEGKKLSISITEAITGLRKEYNDSISRQNSLIKTLEGERNKKLANKQQENASILNYIEKWAEYKERQKFLKFAQEKKKQIGEELNRLETLDSYLAECWGVNKESFTE